MLAFLAARHTIVCLDFNVYITSTCDNVFINSYLCIFLVPAPTVSVTSTPQIVGQVVSLDCSVTTVASVSNSAVNVTWRSNGVVLQRVTEVGTTNPIGNTVVYIHSYIISQLSTTDDGRAYQCEVSISATPPVNATDNIILDVIG